MENNFIQLAASAVAYTIGPIFKHIIDCVQLYFTKGFTNIVQRCQIEAPRWPYDISYGADNAIFKSRAQNIQYLLLCGT